MEGTVFPSKHWWPGLGHNCWLATC